MKKPCILLAARDRLLADLLQRALASDAVDLKWLDLNPGGDSGPHIQADLVILDYSNAADDLRLLDRSHFASPPPKVIVLIGSDPEREEVRLKGFEIVDKRLGLGALVEAIRSSLRLEVPLREEKARILVVDDEEANLEMLSEFLGNKGYGVTTAADGISAMEAVERDPAIKVVLLDIIMPNPPECSAQRPYR